MTLPLDLVVLSKFFVSCPYMDLVRSLLHDEKVTRSIERVTVFLKMEALLFRRISCVQFSSQERFADFR